MKRRPGNGRPWLEAVEDVRAEAGGTVEMEFRAGDPDGDPISFFVQPVGEVVAAVRSAIEGCAAAPQ